MWTGWLHATWAALAHAAYSGGFAVCSEYRIAVLYLGSEWWSAVAICFLAGDHAFLFPRLSFTFRVVLVCQYLCEHLRVLRWHAHTASLWGFGGTFTLYNTVHLLTSPSRLVLEWPIYQCLRERPWLLKACVLQWYVYAALFTRLRWLTPYNAVHSLTSPSCSMLEWTILHITLAGSPALRMTYGSSTTRKGFFFR